MDDGLWARLQQMWPSQPPQGLWQGLDPASEHVRFRTASPLVNITDEDIDRGINIAMSAGPGTIARVPEKIASAATKFGGKIYEGQTHADAYQKYKGETGHGDTAAAAAYGGDGFLTNTGRFVDRQEAQRIVDSASPNVNPADRRTMAQRQLYAEELNTPLAAGLGLINP